MKKYVKPMLQAEEFVPQEYVAACYIVKCSVGKNISLWEESNGVPGLQREATSKTETMSTPQCGKKYHTHTNACYQKTTVIPADTRLASGNGCGTKHPAVLKAPVYNGYVTSRYGNDAPSEFNCFIFQQEWTHTSSGDSDWHGSLLAPGDVDSSNPKAS